MPRVLLLLVAALLLLGPPSSAPAFAHEAAAADDCCPDLDPHDETDCCDYDGGRCCAGTVLALHVPAEPVVSHGALSPSRGPLVPPLPLPRATGPPPTPPPIG